MTFNSLEEITGPNIANKTVKQFIGHFDDNFGSIKFSSTLVSGWAHHDDWKFGSANEMMKNKFSIIWFGPFHNQ